MTEPFQNERVRLEVDGWPGLSLWTRPALLDATVIDEVIVHDTYHLTDLNLRGMTVIDCGAHVGVFSAFCAHRGASRIIAVEPQPENLELLRLNLAAYGRTVTIVPKAIGATAGTTWIVGESGGAHALADGGGDGSLVERVTLTQLLDEFMFENLGLLKLDMEGGEVDAILGCEHEQLARVRQIVMETHGPTICPWVQAPRVGELIEHLLYTHNVDASGSPTHLGRLFATHNGARSGW